MGMDKKIKKGTILTVPRGTYRLDRWDKDTGWRRIPLKRDIELELTVMLTNEQSEDEAVFLKRGSGENARWLLFQTKELRRVGVL
jgi:hypothetical protein